MKKSTLEKILKGTSFTLVGELSAKQIKNAAQSIAKGAKEQDLVGVLDTTLFKSGKEGYAITTNAFYSEREKLSVSFMTIRGISESKKGKSRLALKLVDGSEREFYVASSYQEEIKKMIERIIVSAAQDEKNRAAQREADRLAAEKRKAEARAAAERAEQERMAAILAEEARKQEEDRKRPVVLIEESDVFAGKESISDLSSLLVYIPLHVEYRLSV